MRKSLVLFSILFSAIAANAQYYYKDIISNKQTTADMLAYRDNKVHTVNLKSFDDDGEESEGFFCQKKISKDYRKISMFTRSNISAASEFEAEYDADGKVLNTYDSSDLSTTRIVYTYDANNRVRSVFSRIHSHDEDFENSLTEEHIYTYGEDGVPQGMLKIKNKSDTSLILFASDDKGNIVVEKDTWTAGKYYYYYDAKNRLTDIVQSTDATVKPKPNYMFEYNPAGLVTQMTSVQEGSSNYFIWKYNYDNGMRVKARCFSNERKLMGTIEYENK